MNGETIFLAIAELDDRYIEEAIRRTPGETAADAPERIVHMKKKRIITLALAAALLLALGAAAYAVSAAVASPQAAEKVALEQLEVWKEMGLISPEITFEGPATAIYEFEEEQGGSYWYNRLFPHCYAVRWYGNGNYACNLEVDTKTGKITFCSLTAYPNENDVPGDEVAISDTRVEHYYDIFDHIVSPDMTVDRFCSLLAEYWGFSGYRIGNSADDMWYDENQPEVDGSMRLIERVNRNGYQYLTVFFEGDQEGVPMYVELMQFPGHVALNVGTNHAVG